MKRCIMVFCLALLMGPEPMPTPLKLTGPDKVEAYRQVRMTATGDLVGAALVWDVSPEENADIQELPGGQMVFTGPPGTYRVKVRAIRLKDGTTTADCARSVVEIAPPKGAAPPTTPPVLPPRTPKLDPAAATTRLRVGSSGCTATIMHPRRPDGKWDVLTASHCTGEPGGKGTITLKDGRKLAVTVTVRSRGPDITWMATDDASLDDLPSAVLAATAPAPGTKIWHNGYGIDKPGNREEGVVVSGPGDNGMLTMRLSVSSGDSGGGIFRVDNGELVSAVCCTSSMARIGTMHGGSSVAAAKLRPKSTAEGTHDLIEVQRIIVLPPRPRPRPWWRPRPYSALPRQWRGIARIVADARAAARATADLMTSPLRWSA